MAPSLANVLLQVAVLQVAVPKAARSLTEAQPLAAVWSSAMPEVQTDQMGERAEAEAIRNSHLEVASSQQTVKLEDSTPGFTEQELQAMKDRRVPANLCNTYMGSSILKADRQKSLQDCTFQCGEGCGFIAFKSRDMWCIRFDTCAQTIEANSYSDFELYQKLDVNLFGRATVLAADGLSDEDILQRWRREVAKSADGAAAAKDKAAKSIQRRWHARHTPKLEEGGELQEGDRVTTKKRAKGQGKKAVCIYNGGKRGEVLTATTGKNDEEEIEVKFHLGGPAITS